MKLIEIEDVKYKKFNEIVERSGFIDENLIKREELNGENFIKLIIDKTLQNGSLDWLNKAFNGENNSKFQRKSNAVDLFRNEGYKYISTSNTNFATLQDNGQYWINPSITCLQRDWYIILDNQIDKRLYLFYIPKFQIKNLNTRNDKQLAITIEVINSKFVDILSKTIFSDYQVDYIDYKTLV